MKLTRTIILGFIFLLFPYNIHSASLQVQQPPQSLDKFYSEPGKTSEWIEQMHEINKSLERLTINLKGKDWKRILESAKGFDSAYQKAGKMVPEWKDLFDLEVSKNMIANIKSKNLGKVKQLSVKLKKSCFKCHQKHNISVWIRYHWPSTKTIKVLDPIDEEELTYEQFMNKLSSSFTEIAIYYEQQKYKESWNALDIFSKRLKSLRSVCSKCHVSEWNQSVTTVKDFFVGEDIFNALKKIKRIFATGVPDTKSFKKNMGHISYGSCKMCHLVHQPSAILQKTWSGPPLN